MTIRLLAIIIVCAIFSAAVIPVGQMERCMIIDLLPLLSGEVKELTLDYKEPVSDESYAEYFEGLGSAPGGETEIKGKIYDMTAYMRLKITARLPYKTQCCRCLSDAEGVCECVIDRVLSAVSSDGGEDEVIVYTDRKLDLGQTVLEELSMAFPAKPLCKPDCKGLCPVCGQDLNEGGCEHTAEN